LDIKFVLINVITSAIVAELWVFQYGVCSSVLNIDAKFELEELGSKKIVTSADRAPLNNFLTLRKVIQEEKVSNFSHVFLSNT
jgi:hypothetical protein